MTKFSAVNSAGVAVERIEIDRRAPARLSSAEENAPRSRRVARLTKRDVKRIVEGVLEGVRGAGLNVAQVHVEPNGKVQIITGTLPSHSSAHHGGSGEKFRDIADVL